VLSRIAKSDRRIDELFEEQVDRDRDLIAVRFGDAQLTYRELDARANQVAHRLRALGVTRGALVPVVLERSLDTLAALLGILKADGAYVPIDPHYPAERVAFMLADCAPRVVLAQTRFVERVPAGPWEVAGLDTTVAEPTTRPQRRGTARDIAYGIYTSGSTGTPKCALVMHASLVNLIDEESDRLDATSRVIQNTPLTFDPSVLELFGPLCVGGRVVMPRPDGHRDIRYLPG
jgi:non-ribosomal peptide synthetase component F